jgi:protein-S-isoprenylcysteine O-methyltransferase Ste14
MNPQKTTPLFYLLVGILVIPLLHFLVPVWRLIPIPWNGLGIILVGAGIFLNLSADQLLHSTGTTVDLFEESQVLVAHGVFKISRNPMYLGFAAILLGLAVMYGSLTPFLVVPIFMILVQRRFIRREESKLSREFGQIYLGYKKYVRRWL